MTIQSDSHLYIIQAKSEDASYISEFIDRAIFVHRHLDWRPLLHWIDQEPFLIKLDRGKIQGILSCAPDPEGIAWIHCFAADDLHTYHQTWFELLETARKIPALQGCIICSVGLFDWYAKLLAESEFTLIQNIVVLYWDGKLPPPSVLGTEIFIRPMEYADLDQVIQVDHSAFSPIWTISRSTFDEVYTQSEHSNVAEINGEIVGYEISTANHFSAHLTRLAVKPEYKQANIGYTLGHEMLSFFSRRGIRQISVNTQTDNTASISLYKKLGFRLSEESFPVYCLQI